MDTEHPPIKKTAPQSKSVVLLHNELFGNIIVQGNIFYAERQICRYTIKRGMEKIVGFTVGIRVLQITLGYCNLDNPAR